MRETKAVKQFRSPYLQNSATRAFNWAITYNNVAPVPEPASWAMMIGGLALVGAKVRHRKTTPSFV